MSKNKTKTIAICNQKGGVGKTTTAISLAAALSKAGKKILLVDCDDSNPTLTKALINDDLEAIPYSLVNLMLYTIFDEDISENLSKAIYHHDEGYDVLPGTNKLAGITINLNAQQDPSVKNKTLDKVLSSAAAAGAYDYIIIDAAPALNTMSINVLAAADEVVIVTQAQTAAEKGIVELINTIENVKKVINPSITISGLLITMVHNGAKSSKTMAKDIAVDYEKLNIHIYPPIPRSTAAEQYLRSGKSILAFDPRGKVTAAYQAFADDFLTKKDGDTCD